MNKIIICLLATVSFSGCAVNKFYTDRISNSELAAERKEWVEAYTYVEDCFVFNGEPEKIRELIERHPEIISMGMKDKYTQRLNEVENNCNSANFSNYFFHMRNSSRNSYANDTIKIIINDSRKILNDCASKQQSGVGLNQIDEFEQIVGVNYFTETAKNQAAIVQQKEQQSEKEKSRERTGIIINTQVANESYVNGGEGANVGAAYAQTRYIDNSTLKDYNATNQLGAGLMGAVVGGMLLDKPTRPAYKATYFVKLFSGEVKQVEVTTSTATHFPDGLCVEVFEHKLTMTNQNNCKGLSPTP